MEEKEIVTGAVSGHEKYTAVKCLYSPAEMTDKKNKRQFVTRFVAHEGEFFFVKIHGPSIKRI